MPLNFLKKICVTQFLSKVISPYVSPTGLITDHDRLVYKVQDEITSNFKVTPRFLEMK